MLGYAMATTGGRARGRLVRSARTDIRLALGGAIAPMHAAGARRYSRR
jgi:hypothetical protein